MNATTYAVDIAKSVFHVHWVEPETGEIHNRKLSRAKFSAFIAQRQPGRIVMEACGSAHYWGRTFMALGHQVELLPAFEVHKRVIGNKDDCADAAAIWLTAQSATVRRVPVKTVQQQADRVSARSNRVTSASRPNFFAQTTACVSAAPARA